MLIKLDWHVIIKFIKIETIQNEKEIKKTS